MSRIPAHHAFFIVTVGLFFTYQRYLIQPFWKVSLAIFAGFYTLHLLRRLSTAVTEPLRAAERRRKEEADLQWRREKADREHRHQLLAEQNRQRELAVREAEQQRYLASLPQPDPEKDQAERLERLERRRQQRIAAIPDTMPEQVRRRLIARIEREYLRETFDMG